MSAEAPARRLGLFYKPPRPGQVKTRLVPPLSNGMASRLYAAFLTDSLATARRVPRAEIRLFNGGEPPDWRPGGATDLPIEAQEGVDLGVRMSRALVRLLDPGPAVAIIVGTDAPTLTPAAIDEAFRALESRQVDLALGPVPDGGYCLIGVAHPPGELLNDIAWSRDDVLKSTETRGWRYGWRVRRTTGGYDIDTVEDLERLRSECQALDQAGDDRLALATRRVLRGATGG